MGYWLAVMKEPNVLNGMKFKLAEITFLAYLDPIHKHHYMGLYVDTLHARDHVCVCVSLCMYSMCGLYGNG